MAPRRAVISNMPRKFRERQKEPAHVPPPWPTISESRHNLEVTLYPATPSEALQRQKKKMFEEGRSSEVAVGRCPFKGGYNGGGGRRRNPSPQASRPVLFTVPNFLTPEECESFINVAEARGFWYQSRRHFLHACAGGASFDRNREYYSGFPDVYGSAFSRTNAMFDMIFPARSTLMQRLWTRGLDAVFEGVIFEGREGVPAVGLSGVTIHRYERGESCEAHWHASCKDQSYLSKQCTFPGYDVLVYLNGGAGSSDEAICRSNREPHRERLVDRPVVGGETVFYSHRYGGTTPMAKIAPVTGMAVCHILGDRCPVHEGKPVKEGVKYVMQLRVVFSNSP